MQKSWVRKGLVVGIIVLFVGMSVVPISYANEKCKVYVDDDNNSGYEDGTPNYPYNTITEGIVNVCEGGTVCVGNGSYNENIVIDKGLNLTKTDMVYPGNTPHNYLIIDGGGIGSVITIQKVQEYGVRIDGFDIRNSGKGTYDTGIYISESYDCDVWHNNLNNNGNGIRITDSKLIDIDDNDIYNNLIGNGIGIEGNSDNIDIVHNIIYNCEYNGIYAVNLKSNDSKININDNTIFSCKKGDGIILLPSSNGIDIINNKIYDCGIRPPGQENGNGIKISDSRNIKITHNNIINATSGIFVYGAGRSSEILIMNNNVSECYHNGIYINGPVGANCYYNNVFENGLNYDGFGSGIFLETVDTKFTVIKFTLKNNYIHGNHINVLISNSNGFGERGYFRENNITDPAPYHFYGYHSIVHAEHNYWGTEGWPSLRTAILNQGFYICFIFPFSDHVWSCTPP